VEMRDLQHEQHVFRCITIIRTVFAASVPVISSVACAYNVSGTDRPGLQIGSPVLWISSCLDGCFGIRK